MKKLFFLLFSFQFVLTMAQEQSLKAQLVSKQEIDTDVFVGFDTMENWYYIKNNILFKSKKGESFEYKNISLGKPTKIDIQNPLKIMLFYESFNTIILLDNQLSETQKINLSENDVPIMATATGIASQNKLWIYNSLTQQIGLFDYLKNTFQTITPAFQGNIKYYQSDFNTFQWIDNNLNWFSCDVFGKITNLGRVADFDQAQITSNQSIIFSKQEKIYIQNFKNNAISPIENVEKSFKNFYYKDQILSIFTNQGISNYKILIP
jgi:hypothetical protein